MATKTWNGSVGNYDSGNWAPSPPVEGDTALIQSGLVNYSNAAVWNVTIQLGSNGQGSETPSVFMHDAIYGNGITDPSPIHGSAVARVVIDDYAYWLGRNTLGDSFTGTGTLDIGITTGSFFFTTGETDLYAGSFLYVHSQGGLLAQYGNMNIIGGTAVMDTWVYGPGRFTLETSFHMNSDELVFKSGVDSGITVDLGDNNVGKALQIDHPLYFLGGITNFDNAVDVVLLGTGSASDKYEGGRLELFDAQNNIVASVAITGENGAPLNTELFHVVSDGQHSQVTYMAPWMYSAKEAGHVVAVDPGSLHPFA